MRFWFAVIFAVLPLFLQTSAAAQKLSRKEKAAMRLTVDEVAELITVKGADDPLDLTITLSSEEFLEKKYNDRFFRSFIDKKNGSITYQMYFIVSVRQSPRLKRLTFAYDNEVHQVEVSRVHFDVSCYRSSCTHIEHGVATIPEKAIEEFSQCARPGSDSTFRMKLYGDGIGDQDVITFCTEAAGIMQATLRESAKLGS